MPVGKFQKGHLRFKKDGEAAKQILMTGAEICIVMG